MIPRSLKNLKNIFTELFSLFLFYFFFFFFTKEGRKVITFAHKLRGRGKSNETEMCFDKIVLTFSSVKGGISNLHCVCALSILTLFMYTFCFTIVSSLNFTKEYT